MDNLDSYSESSDADDYSDLRSEEDVEIVPEDNIEKNESLLVKQEEEMP